MRKVYLTDEEINAMAPEDLCVAHGNFHNDVFLSSMEDMRELHNLDGFDMTNIELMDAPVFGFDYKDIKIIGVVKGRLVNIRRKKSKTITRSRSIGRG